MHRASVDCGPMLDDRTLARYADAIVRSCLAIRPDDLLAVHGEPAHRELILALTRAAYADGARLRRRRVRRARRAPRPGRPVAARVPRLPAAVGRAAAARPRRRARRQHLDQRPVGAAADERRRPGARGAGAVDADPGPPHLPARGAAQRAAVLRRRLPGRGLVRARVPRAAGGRGDPRRGGRPGVVLPRAPRRPRGRLGPSRRAAHGAGGVAERPRARPDRAARAGHRARGRPGARQSVVRRRRHDHPRRPVPRQHADRGVSSPAPIRGARPARSGARGR